MIRRKTRQIYHNWKAYLHRYVWPLPKFHREVVVMVDGKMFHGGLTDRFRNILSVYDYCKSHTLPFKLYYIHPCDLKKILAPASYDWRIGTKELSHHFADTKEIVLYVKPIESYPTEEDFITDNNLSHTVLLDQATQHYKHTQFHVYGNSMMAEGRYKSLFEELFTPTAYLQSRINQCLHDMPEEYEAVTLRFQQLLGDFEEGNFKVLSSLEREGLINCCINKIMQLRQEGAFSTKKLLVTSDSVTFIHQVSKVPGIYTIPGEMKHMDFTNDKDIAMNAKSFLDLHLLSRAKRITLLQTGSMYKSGFPRFAAELGGKPFRTICF